MSSAGLLTEVFAPDAQQEADRELVRLRTSAKENLNAARQQIDKFLTRNGYIYNDGNNWTQKHLRWLLQLKFEVKGLKSIFHHYLDEMTRCFSRVEMLDKEIQELADSPQYQERVGVLRCYVGIDTLTAMSLILEIFNFQRFESARALMSYLGLTPSESSSGGKVSKGRITKTGNKRVRRLLNETAWHYRHTYLPSKILKERRCGQPQWAIDIADNAGHRLTRRKRNLMERGKMACKTNIEIARELAGFIWATMTEYEIRNGA